MEIHRQCFQMAYHMNGGATLEYLWWSLPVHLRNFYFNELDEQRKRERKQAESSSGGGGGASDGFSGEGVPQEFKERAKAQNREGYAESEDRPPSLQEIMNNASPDLIRGGDGDS